MIEAGYGSVVRSWASAIFGLATGLAMLVVAEQMAVGDRRAAAVRLALSAVDWWTMLAALGLVRCVPGNGGDRSGRLVSDGARSTS